MHFIPTKCPNQNCLAEPRFIKKGFHNVLHLNQKFRIFQCKNCKRYFTSRTFRLDYRHKRSDLNRKVALLLVEGVSLRGISRIEGLTYKNTYNKFLFIKSDMHPSYRKLVQEAFPRITYAQYLGKDKKKKHQERLHENLRKCVFDPLWAVNHGGAMIGILNLEPKSGAGLRDFGGFG